MIYLIGFMGSGKTTVGEYLGERLGIPCIEMDEQIEKNEDMTIREMFSSYGEEYFREKETAFLSSLEGQAVVSTGGGVVLSENNQLLLKQGTTVYLKAEWETIVERLQGDKNRPLWKGDREERKLRFEERLPIYENAADLVVQVDGRSPLEICDEIIQRLK
ncbi:shikimate kinase [Halobacillus litoralis]|uniref:shikimate kinase n=1 Tax=Halobacillus litoralis TaxID=45668 RepID=UPI001CFCB2C4|nr:shikimate kinase [Halobacillus litoralis]